MEQLITITTDGQGSSVVSARELHAFLKSRQQFADWIKARIKQYRLVEGQDYTAVSESYETGGRSTEYLLTLNAAKELSMVERNAKGQQARQYFIQCEETLRSVAERPANTVLATDPVLLQLLSQQTQLITNQQALLDQLRAEVKQIQQTGHRPPKSRPGQQLTVPGLPERRRQSFLRSQINQRVDIYCNHYSCDRRETWNYLYKRLYLLYGVNTHQLIRRSKENLLDALERYGHLEQFYKIVREELPANE